LTAGVAFADIERSQWFSVASSMILYVLAGAISGHVADLLRRLERDISAARARDEVARTLHDGVLQTLAIIERRADDVALARLAREQERELREYLFGIGAAVEHGGARDVGPTLREVAAKFEDRFDGRAHIVLAPDLPTFAAERVAALGGAVGEALTNAGKHGDATTVFVYVEPDDDVGVVCSVRDNGCGFDPAKIVEGVGLRRSIRERIDEMGGRVEIESRLGGGTEVRLWLPS
jgi:signal transduction histidine kinase